MAKRVPSKAEIDRAYERAFELSKRRNDAIERDVKSVIRKNATLILSVADEMYKAGEHMNAGTVYHAVKKQLGLPIPASGNVFEEIDRLLDRAGWVDEDPKSAMFPK